jgi:hypothetical protein
MTLKVGKSRNQCSGCLTFFNSLRAFEKHRTGKHGVDRRCMTPDEMLAKGMSINEAGYWIASKMEGWKSENNTTEDDEEAVEQ